MSEVVHDRHEDVGKHIGRCRILAEVGIFFIKDIFSGFFMTENLDDLLAIDHFFDIPIDIADRSLLADEIGAASARYKFSDV